jgi:hypothetical protein
VDKTLGKTHLSIQPHGDVQAEVEARILQFAAVSKMQEGALPRLPEEPAAYGGKKLGMICSYCPYKQRCWQHANQGAGIRTFIYKSGPVFMTEMGHKEPDVPEVL